jgi:hypothetical protein
MLHPAKIDENAHHLRETTGALTNSTVSLLTAV